MATDAQVHYIECLAIDLGFDRLNRNWAISDLVGRQVKFLDELTVPEASRVIDDFKSRKDGEDDACGNDPNGDYRK